MADNMNVFGFSDDLGPQLDDRLIIKNPAENARYLLVERPDYLLTFEGKESEREFLFRTSKQEAKKTSIVVVMLLILNKLIIVGDLIERPEFEATPQFIAMFPIFVIECILIYKLNNPTKATVDFWTTVLQLYGTIVLSLLMTLLFKHLGTASIRANFNELLFELTLSLFFMMRNIFLRHFVICYGLYVVVAAGVGIYYRENLLNYQAL